MKQKVLKAGIIFLGALGLFLIGMAWGASLVVPQPLSNQATNKNLTLLINNGRQINSYSQVVVNQVTAFGLLQQMAKEKNLVLVFDSPEKSPLGVFVKQIGDQSNGQSQKYWQYWVNGQQPPVAADKYVLKSGDTVLWTFSESVF